MELPKAYMNEIRKITGYWGTYFPSNRLMPGMVGRVKDGLFENDRMLSESPGFDPALHSVGKPEPSRNLVQVWQSENVSAITVRAGANVPGVPASGASKFGFNKANNAVMICKELRGQGFQHLGQVKTLLHGLLETGQWDTDLCLITEVRLVKAAWICFATSSDQEAVVSASGSVGLGLGPIDALKDLAAKGELSTSWNSSKSAGYKTELTEGGTPLFLAIRFKRSIPLVGAYDLQFLKGDSRLFEEPEFGESENVVLDN